MTKQTIILGTAPKGSDGDTSRVAFEKTQQNFDELYARAQGKLSKDVSGGAGVVNLSDSEALNGFIDLTGLLTGALEVTVTADPSQSYVVRNSTSGGFPLTFKTVSGSGVTVRMGQTTVVISDGENILSLSSDISGRLLRVRVLAVSGTYVPGEGTRAIRVRGVGGGGPGGGCPAAPSGVIASGGGGAGGYFEAYLTSGFSSVAYVIGAAGVPSTGMGSGGGTTSFGSITATGGGSGGPGQVVGGGSTIGAYGAGGTSTGANIANVGGSPGGMGIAVLTPFANAYGGGGGSSPLGSGGSPNVSGGAGRGYGAGGSGTQNYNSASTLVGGLPTGGVIIVEEFS